MLFECLFKAESRKRQLQFMGDRHSILQANEMEAMENALRELLTSHKYIIVPADHIKEMLVIMDRPLSFPDRFLDGYHERVATMHIAAMANCPNDIKQTSIESLDEMLFYQILRHLEGGK